MAATKRKPVRSTARKAVKKTTARMQKKPKTLKAQPRKTKGSQKKTTQKVVRSAPIVSPNKPYTKTELLSTLSGHTGLQRKEVSTVFNELGNIISAHLKKQGPGQFTLPGLIKIIITHKPATKARKGINPFTGEEIMFKAKPARNVVKVRALKKLKQMVA